MSPASKRMRTFSKLNNTMQWAISIVFFSALILIGEWWISKVADQKALMLLIFILVPIIQFLITPLFTQIKLYRYYSPMVVTFGKNKRVLDLHNGTSFDYLFNMNKTKPGRAWKKRMLTYYLDALLSIIKEIEDGKISTDVTVRGSSYFLSERSARKLGFRSFNTSILEKINISLNYLDLLWMYSLSEGKIIFPDLRKISTVSIKGHELIERKSYIQNLISKLRKNNVIR